MGFKPMTSCLLVEMSRKIPIHFGFDLKCLSFWFLFLCVKNLQPAPTCFSFCIPNMSKGEELHLLQDKVFWEILTGLVSSSELFTHTTIPAQFLTDLQYQI